MKQPEDRYLPIYWISLNNSSSVIIHTLQAFQLLSFGIFPFLAKSTMTAAVTLTTMAGGLPNDFSSVRLLYKKKSMMSEYVSYFKVHLSH